MATLSFSVASPVAGSRTGRVSGMLRSVVETFAAEWRARRAARSVESLSDEMLHDIGITRGEIDRAVRYGRGRA